jgi:hypothetical protein
MKMSFHFKKIQMATLTGTTDLGNWLKGKLVLYLEISH